MVDTVAAFAVGPGLPAILASAGNDSAPDRVAEGIANTARDGQAGRVVWRAAFRRHPGGRRRRVVAGLRRVIGRERHPGSAGLNRLRGAGHGAFDLPPYPECHDDSYRNDNRRRHIHEMTPLRHVHPLSRTSRAEPTLRAMNPGMGMTVPCGMHSRAMVFRGPRDGNRRGRCTRAGRHGRSVAVNENPGQTPRFCFAKASKTRVGSVRDRRPRTPGSPSASLAGVPARAPQAPGATGPVPSAVPRTASSTRCTRDGWAASSLRRATGDTAAYRSTRG